jgi:hypothetical protein
MNEQRYGLLALGRLHPGTRRGQLAEQQVSILDWARLIHLAMNVLSMAAAEAESECRRIVLAAEALAAELVREARSDVGQISTWLDAGAATGGPVSERPPMPVSNTTDAGFSTPVTELRRPDTGPSSPERADAASSAEDDFFDSFHTPDEDRWGFMFDDELVGVGATLRRVLRRPTSPRPPRTARS